MQRLREHESHVQDPYAAYNSHEQHNPQHCNGTHSVLSLDNREFLERPRSKSPDMRNKRMIIGQKSFAFGNDGDLIEIQSGGAKGTFEGSQDGNACNAEESTIVRENIADHCDCVLDETNVPDMKEILPKQFSFQDGTEYYDNLSANAANESLYPLKENEDREAFCEIRRASDGYSDAKFAEIASMVHERRHSDGVIHVTRRDNKPVLAEKRKTLKRQKRVSDTDAMMDCDSKLSTPNVVRSEESDCSYHKHIHESSKREGVCRKSIRNIGERIKLRRKSRNEAAIKCSRNLSKDTGSGVELAGNDLSIDEQQHQHRERDNDEHCTDRAQAIERQYEDDEMGATCCCQSPSKKKYWMKMERMIQENNNLEGMVRKNKREMAEIREMLNSVLSVRLEPGF